MIRLFRSAALLTALALPVISAHAAPVTYTGTVSLTDTTTHTSIGTFTNPFSFTDPPTGGVIQFDDPYTIAGRISDGDHLDLNVSFTAPGIGSGDGAGSADFSYIFSTNYIQWNTAEQTIDLSNGSIVDINLPTWFGDPVVTLSACRAGLCGSSDVYMQVTDNDPPAASPTPEPSSLMLLGTGILGAAGLVRRKLAL